MLFKTHPVGAIPAEAPRVHAEPGPSPVVRHGTRRLRGRGGARNRVVGHVERYRAGDGVTIPGGTGGQAPASRNHGPRWRWPWWEKRRRPRCATSGDRRWDRLPSSWSLCASLEAPSRPRGGAPRPRRRPRRSTRASSLLARAAPPLVTWEHTRSAQAPSFELARELPDDVPAADYRRLGNRSRQGIFDGAHVARFRWAKRDQLTRTYVNSRRVVRT